MDRGVVGPNPRVRGQQRAANTQSPIHVANPACRLLVHGLHFTLTPPPVLTSSLPVPGHAVVCAAQAYILKVPSLSTAWWRGVTPVVPVREGIDWRGSGGNVVRENLYPPCRTLARS